MIAVVTLVVTVLLYIVVPKGFFPVQDTGVMQGISVASQTASFDAMAQHQQDLADAILKDPDVVSLSSFIGVDGNNMTLNTGRFLINLKPKDDRTLDATEIADRIQQETADVPGVSLYLQPVQDLTLDASVSRTQYQFVLENPNLSAFTEWVPKLLTQMRKSPDLTNIASDLQEQGAGREPGDRPGKRGALRHHSGDGGQRAVRSVRAADHLDDLHAVEPVSRHHGGRARRCRPR